MEMENQKWTDERTITTLAKSGQTTLFLSNKSRAKIQRALFEENARLREARKPAQKPRRGLSGLLASLSSH